MKEQIIQFRDILRQFEQEIEIQNSNCCDTGISMSQCHALLDIEQNQPTIITEIANRHSLDKSTISRTVDGLVTMGLANRIENPESRRQSIITLTDNGKSVCSKINSLNNNFFKTIFKDVPENELNIFLNVFKMVTLGMKNYRENEKSNSCCN